MAMIDDFKARFPNFEYFTQLDAVFPIFEAIYPEYYNGNYDNARDKEIILNLIGHLIVDQQTGGSGANKAIASQSVGSVSVSYESSALNARPAFAFFSWTKYGSRYLSLTADIMGGHFV